MAKKVEIVALVSVLGQPSYDKSRWANFFGEKLAKVTKGKDKIAAINAGASLFKKFVASIKDLDKQYSLKNVTLAAKALEKSADAAETNAENYSAKMRRWLRAAPSCDKAEDVRAHVGDMEDAGFTPVDDDELKKLFEDEDVQPPGAKRPKTEDSASPAAPDVGQPVALLDAVKALNATIKNGFDAVVAAIEAHTASKQDES